MKFKRLKIPSGEAIPYLKNDDELSQYWEQLNRDCYGEIIIDSNTLDHIGHVFVWHTKKNKGFIFNLEVKPQYRRQGYGRILLDDAVKKYDGVDLLVDEDNIPAIKLYEKYGFETIKTVNGQLWMKLNQIKQEGVIMFIDRLGNDIMKPEDIEVEIIEMVNTSRIPTREGFVIQESRKTHKTRFLERNKYDPETGTYETDILDENGKKIRVPLRISATESNKMRWNNRTGKPVEIVINRKTAKSKNWNSQMSLKHEEGHVKQNLGQRDKELDQADDFVKRNNIDPTDIHGTAKKELDADRYAAEHVSKRAAIMHFERWFQRGKDCLHRIKKRVDSVKKLTQAEFQKNKLSTRRIDWNGIQEELSKLNYEYNSLIECRQELQEDLERTIKTYRTMRRNAPHRLNFRNPNYSPQELDEYLKENRKYCAEDLKETKQKIQEIDKKIQTVKNSKNPHIIEREKSILKEIKDEMIKLVERDVNFNSRETQIRINHIKQMIINESYIDDDEFVPREIILEEKINTADRNDLDDKCFGLVYTDENGKKVRKYPLTDKDGKLDENHVRQAVRFFNHCPKEHQHQLALKILHAAHKLGLDTTKWDTVNKAAEEKDDK